MSGLGTAGAALTYFCFAIPAVRIERRFEKIQRCFQSTQKLIDMLINVVTILLTLILVTESKRKLLHFWVACGSQDNVRLGIAKQDTSPKR